MCFSSQLSKASGGSGCEQDLPVSKCSDHEVVQPVVSHQKLLFPGCGLQLGWCTHLSQLCVAQASSATLHLAGWAVGEAVSLEK